MRCRLKCSSLLEFGDVRLKRGNCWRPLELCDISLELLDRPIGVRLRGSLCPRTSRECQTHRAREHAEEPLHHHARPITHSDPTVRFGLKGRRNNYGAVDPA